MYESISIVGERGQITIPKIIRDKEHIRPKDEVIVKIEDGKLVVEKSMGKKEKEALMIEGYKRMAKENEKLSEEMLAASAEVWCTE